MLNKIIEKTYPLLRTLLFQLDAETAHHISLKALNIVNKLGLLTYNYKESEAVELMGLKFPNKIGLAAGLDKNGVCVEAFSKLWLWLY